MTFQIRLRHQVRCTSGRLALPNFRTAPRQTACVVLENSAAVANKYSMIRLAGCGGDFPRGQYVVESCSLDPHPAQRLS